MSMNLLGLTHLMPCVEFRSKLVKDDPSQQNHKGEATGSFLKFRWRRTFLLALGRSGMRAVETEQEDNFSLQMGLGDLAKTAN